MLVKDKARQDAAEALEATWTAGFPVDPARVASQLGIAVHYLPLEDGISGMLQVEPGFDAEIYVNENDTQQRQRFTIAHELGHYYERAARGMAGANFIDKREPGKYDLHEFYADEFAGALLMPKDEIDRLQAEQASPAKMATYFGVSLAAMQKRLERLRG